MAGLCSTPDLFFWDLSFCSLELILVKTAALCVAMLVIGGSLLKYFELSRDPEAIAKALGGTPVEPGTARPEYRRLINVVEEMAIASGTPVPKVYVLEGDQSLNAFAAGHDIHHALVAVTEGLLLSLSRAELQAVIAHEFSHIVHEDMRLNRNLLVVVHGIAMISLFGAAIVRNFTTARPSRFSSRKNGTQSVLPILVFGMLIYVIGYFGLLMSRLLKASISRQREFLADASAVQYTRNPSGLAQSFKKIWAATQKKFDQEAASDELYSHFFFFTPAHLLSSHPPLTKRIERVEPNFNPKRFEKEELPRLVENLHKQTSELEENGRPALKSDETMALTSQELQASLGSVNDRSLEKARSLREGLPSELRRQASDPVYARDWLRVFLLSPNPQVRAKQLIKVWPTDAHQRKNLSKLSHELEGLTLEQRDVYFDLCLATFKHFVASPTPFLKELSELIQAGDERGLDQFLTYEYVSQSLAPPPAGRKRQASPEALQAFFTLLARLAVDDHEERERLALTALKSLGIEPKTKTPTSDLIREALSHLRQFERERLVAQCLTMIHQDGIVTVQERHLMRLLCSVLGLAMPLCVQ